MPFHHITLIQPDHDDDGSNDHDDDHDEGNDHDKKERKSFEKDPV